MLRNCPTMPSAMHSTSGVRDKMTKRAMPRGERLTMRIFSDFDGTMTIADTIMAVMAHFDPPGWKKIVENMFANRTSVRHGVGQLFSLFPSAYKEAIVSYVTTHVKFRSGLQPLLSWCAQQNIPFYVVSGGVDFFIDPLIATWNIPKHHVYCNMGDFSGERIRIVWPHPCDRHCVQDCGLCKPSVMRALPQADVTVMVGDSLTDYGASREADVVFARAHLATYCAQHHLTYVPFHTFDDVLTHLTREFF